jgi:hypothetical protein
MSTTATATTTTTTTTATTTATTTTTTSLPKFMAELFDRKLRLYVRAKGNDVQFRGNISMPASDPNMPTFVLLSEHLNIKLNSNNSGRGAQLQMAANKLQLALEAALPYMKTQKELVTKFLELRVAYKDRVYGKLPHIYEDRWDAIEKELQVPKRSFATSTSELRKKLDNVEVTIYPFKGDPSSDSGSDSSTSTNTATASNPNREYRGYGEYREYGEGGEGGEEEEVRLDVPEYNEEDDDQDDDPD